MTELPVLENAYLAIAGGKIQDYGAMEDLEHAHAARILDASGCCVLPCFVDSHTHLVFAASREEEFVMKIKGATYAQIAAAGGGILNSAHKLQAMTVEDEMKMLRVARRLGSDTPLTVKTTLLGAHAVPKSYTKTDYIKLVIEEMVPAAAGEALADYIDVFCEEGFFTAEETVRIAEAGKRHGLQPRIHANQLGRSGGVQAGVKVGAVSVDHLENIGLEEIDLLKGSSTIPTALPAAAFFLNLPFPPARAMLQAGLPLAIASDYNPGSSPTGNMPFVLSLACIKMRMTPEEAINAATLNTAAALGLQDTHGSITRGKIANVLVTKPIPSLAFIPYSVGSQLIDKVILNGELV